MPLHHVAFRLVPLDGRRSIEVYVDGRPLRDLAEAFERSRSYDPAGGYVGIVPFSWPHFDPVEYFLGGAPEDWLEPPATPLLGCSCGELGCWPLAAQVSSGAAEVTWAGFSQPHRPQWSYDGFGPFVFDREEYGSAVRQFADDVTNAG